MHEQKTNLVAQDFPYGLKRRFSSEKISDFLSRRSWKIYFERAQRSRLQRLKVSKLVLIYFRKNLPLGYE